MNLVRKQKILITLIIIAFAFIVWQLYAMLGNSESNSESVSKLAQTNTVPAPIIAAAKPQAPITTAPISAANQINTATTAENLPPQPLQLHTTISRSQREYLQLLNRYEIVKMKRMVVDEEAAIAESQAKIAQLNQQTQRLTGGGGVNLGAAPMAAPSSRYQLVYVDYQNGRWSATINNNGRFVEISRGMTLPDGAQISWIDQRGVILQRSGVNYVLNFSGMRAIRYDMALNPVPLQSATKPANNIPSPVPPTATPTPITLKPGQPPLKNSNPAPTIPRSNSVSQRTVASVAAPTLITLKPTPIKTSSPTNISTNKPPLNQPNLPPKQPNTATNANLASVLPGTMTRVVNSSSEKPNSTTSINANTKTPPNNTAQNTQPSAFNLTTSSVSNNPPISTNLNANSTTSVSNTKTGALMMAATTAPINNSPTATKSKSPLALTASQKEKVVQLETYMSTKQEHLITANKQHLLNLPGDHFTLQLLSSDKLNDLTDFIKTNKLTNDVYIYRTDKDRYVLIYGIYPSEVAATAAIKQLPHAAQELKPWVRSIASVQEALNQKPKIAIESH